MESVLLLLGVIFLALIFLGIPVAYAMILTAAAHFYVLSPGLSPTVIAQRPVGLISESFTLLAVPLFLLAGNLLNACGMTARLVAFSVALVGHVRGGLGHAVVVANVIMAGMSGSATADAAGIGSIMIPSLIRAGFSPRAAAALTASAATLGPIIPPSVAMVLYASLSNVSLGRLLLAGFLPGFVMALFLMVDLWLSRESQGVARTRFEWRRLLTTARDAILALIMPAIILGGMFGGEEIPSGRFNGGEKAWFWGGVVLLGASYPKVGVERRFIETFSAGDYTDVERQSRTLQHVFAFDLGNRNLSGGDRPERVFTAFVWGDPMAAAGTRPWLGRGFTREEGLGTAERVAILSHRVWLTRFGGDSSLVGRTIEVDGEPVVVVGMPGLPPRFESHSWYSASLR